MAENGVFTGKSYSGLTNMKNLLFNSLIIGLLSTSLLAGDTTADRLTLNRDMVRNFFKSLVVPGWGQVSNGHKIRAAVYLTAELAGIYEYRTKFAEGDETALEFKAYADEHWDYQVWSFNDNGETACGNLRTHQMPTYIDDDGNVQPYKDHHFYENISKYPEFVCGWDDIDESWNEAEKIYTPNKLTYIKMRTHSNDLYKQAQVAGTLIMVNHLISAFDAALGTDLKTFQTQNLAGKFYINPLSRIHSIGLEVKF